MLFGRLAPVLAAASLWSGAAAFAEEDAAAGHCAGGGLCAAPAAAGASGGSALVQLKSRLGVRAGGAADAAEASEEEETAEATDISEVLLQAGGTAEATDIAEALLQAGGTRACTAAERDEFVAYHNAMRCRHGSPPVAWSEAVAESANAYVSPLTSMRHSDSYNIPPPAGPAGENLYQNSVPGFTPAQVVQLWYDEVNYCRGGPEGFTDGCYTSANGKQTGHFTALIWKGVKKIGCAISNNGKIAICRYKSGKTLSSNSANMGPQSNYVAQVPRRIKTASQCPVSSGPSPVPSPPVPSPPVPPSTPAPAPPSAPVPTPGCKDSKKYRDPQFGAPCSVWAGYPCSGYPFSKKLKKKCARACGQC